MSDEHLARSVEIGLALFSGLLAFAVGVLLLGRVSGGLARHSSKAEGAPSSGSVPTERHQNVVSSSPR